MIFPFTVIEELFKANTEDGWRIYVNQGGTSSGKTYTIMQVLFYYAMSEPNMIITVCGQDLPNLKKGAIRDAKSIINGSEWLQRFMRYNESDHYISCINHSIIEFNSYADAQDAKSGKRDYLFINEANGISYDVFWELQIRTRRKVYIDYNPNARFWVHEELIGKSDVRLIISDHRVNVFLTEQQHELIESIADPELHKVYARGKTGKLTGLIFPNYSIVDELPPNDEWKIQARGLDWGYSNDPTALINVVLAHGELWMDEEIYEPGLTNPEIAERCKEIGITRKDLIIADCAEEKSIKEVKNEGLWLIPSVKGKDSIRVGIDILKRYKWNITRRSKGLREEVNNYKYKTDRDGKKTNEPIDKWNHAIDAVRYVGLLKLAVRRTGTARAHYNSLD